MSGEDVGRRVAKKVNYWRLHNSGMTEGDSELEADWEVASFGLGENQEWLPNTEGQSKILVENTPYELQVGGKVIKGGSVLGRRSAGDIECIPESQIGGKSRSISKTGLDLDPATEALGLSPGAEVGHEGETIEITDSTVHSMDSQRHEYTVLETVGQNSSSGGFIPIGMAVEARVVYESEMLITENKMSNIQDEINAAALKERQEAADREKEELERRAKLLMEQMAVEAKERQIGLLKKQLSEINGRKKASTGEGHGGEPGSPWGG